MHSLETIRHTALLPRKKTTLHRASPTLPWIVHSHTLQLLMLSVAIRIAFLLWNQTCLHTYPLPACSHIQITITICAQAGAKLFAIPTLALARMMITSRSSLAILRTSSCKKSHHPASNTIGRRLLDHQSIQQSCRRTHLTQSSQSE